jgi:energy-coupling factor transport system permease protein
LWRSKRPKHGSVLDRSVQVQHGESPVHRLNAGVKLVIALMLSALAVVAGKPWMIIALLGLEIGLYRVAGLGMALLWLDLRVFLLQVLILVALHMLRFDPVNGFWTGLKTGLQILLLFLPAAIFLRTTRSSQLMGGLRRVMPARIVFIIFTSFRFIPFFAREMEEIALMQRLRGAPISPRHLINPVNWKALFDCLFIPLLVRAIKTADETALSAEARGFRIQAVPEGHPKKRE